MLILDGVIILVMYNYTICACVNLFCTTCLGGSCFWWWLTASGVYAANVWISSSYYIELASVCSNLYCGIEYGYVPDWVCQSYHVANVVHEPVFMMVVSHNMYLLHLHQHAHLLAAAGLTP